jgi:hypothetical protein
MAFVFSSHFCRMFRTYVLYLWLQMVGLTVGLFAAAALVSAVFVPDFKLSVMLVLMIFPLTLAALTTLIVLGLPMLILLQRLLLAVGARTGRPTKFSLFRRWLTRYSVVPAALPLLAFVLPAARQQILPTAVLLVAWAVATMLVWRFNARRLYLEWEAGVPY